MVKTPALAILVAAFLGFLAGCAQYSESESTAVAQPEQPASAGQGPDAPGKDDLAEQVARMGAIGYSVGGVFSPDGERVAFVSNASGVPNVWIADADAGNLTQVTESEDQVGNVAWSPTSDTLAITIAPGGGLNSQIYLMPAEGGEKRMITAGGKVNNWLGDWSDNGRYVSFSSSAESENGMDCWLHDTETGENRLIVRNQGIGVCRLAPDNRHVVAWRMVSRGNTDLYLVELESGEEQHLTPHEGVALSQGGLFLDNATLVFATNCRPARCWRISTWPSSPIPPSAGARSASTNGKCRSGR